MLSPDLGHFRRGSEECWEQMLRRISIMSWDICYMLRFPGKGRLFFIRDWKKKWKLVTLSCLTLREPTRLVHGILQARILEWVASSFSRGLSQLRDGTQVSDIAGGFLYHLSHQKSPSLSLNLSQYQPFRKLLIFIKGNIFKINSRNMPTWDPRSRFRYLPI